MGNTSPLFQPALIDSVADTEDRIFSSCLCSICIASARLSGVNARLFQQSQQIQVKDMEEAGSEAGSVE